MTFILVKIVSGTFITLIFFFAHVFFIDLQILTEFLYICNKIYINNESCKCIEFDAELKRPF